MDSFISNPAERTLTLLPVCEANMRRSTHQPGGTQLNRLMTHHLDSGGRRTRATWALNAGLRLGLSDCACVHIASACELIHNASLLLDDIQDQDTQRRGRVAAWLAFDANCAMCASTLMLSAAFESLAHMPGDVGHLVRHTHARTADLVHGQVRDLNHGQAPLDLAQYERIACQKSGSLLALPLELVMIAAQQSLALPVAKQAGERFSVAYQMADDLNDLEDDLARGAFNVVCVLMASGLTREQAMTEAAHHALASLEQARCFADQLPCGSGQALVQMCPPLALELMAFTTTQSKQT